jgi:Flp pilus assembly pilin Flp
MRLRRSLLTARRFHCSRQGATTAEYAVMIAVMAAAAVVILSTLQAGMRTFSTAVNERLALESETASGGATLVTGSAGQSGSAGSSDGSSAGGTGNAGGSGNARGAHGNSGNSGNSGNAGGNGNHGVGTGNPDR